MIPTGGGSLGVAGRADLTGRPEDAVVRTCFVGE